MLKPDRCDTPLQLLRPGEHRKGSVGPSGACLPLAKALLRSLSQGPKGGPLSTCLLTVICRQRLNASEGSRNDCPRQDHNLTQEPVPNLLMYYVTMKYTLLIPT